MMVTLSISENTEALIVLLRRRVIVIMINAIQAN